MQNFWCKAIKSDEKIVFGVVSLEKITKKFLAYREAPPLSKVSRTPLAIRSHCLKDHFQLHHFSVDDDDGTVIAQGVNNHRSFPTSVFNPKN